MVNRPPPNRRPARKKDDGPRIVVAPPVSFQDEPFLLTAPELKDLAPYGARIIAALASGYGRGVKDPCVIAIWRGSDYARKRGLGRSDDPFTFEPISGDDLQSLTGVPAYFDERPEDVLPRFALGLTGKNRVDSHMSIDVSTEGVVLSWRYSRKFRRDSVTRRGMTEEGIVALEEHTGIGRGD